jgi:predicted porin
VVSASSQNAATGQLAVKAVDGVIDGYPGDYTREWATLGQQAGAWLNLAFAKPYTVDHVVLYDRPNLNDQITGATLTFSDGSVVAVGALNNAGAASTVSFTARSTTSVRLTVTSTSASTFNVGLAEIQVYGSASGTSTSPPIANAGSAQSVASGAAVMLNGSGSSDPQGYPLTYAWTQTAGPSVTLTNPNSAFPSFTAPSGLNVATALTFQLIVNDGIANSTPAAVIVTVTPPVTSANIASLAVVTASSANTSTAQLAVKAVDGVIDGYPGDYTREWATLGQQAGAWLNLAFAKAYTVDHVVLYDRPNLNDQITGGTLTFSDGSTVTVPALDNAGAATSVSFTPRSTTSLRLTITSVAPTTLNVGLAEIQVFGK